MKYLSIHLSGRQLCLWPEIMSLAGNCVSGLRLWLQLAGNCVSDLGIASHSAFHLRHYVHTVLDVFNQILDESSYQFEMWRCPCIRKPRKRQAFANIEEIRFHTFIDKIYRREQINLTCSVLPTYLFLRHTNQHLSKQVHVQSHIAIIVVSMLLEWCCL